jgi:hypothetical protein
MLDLILAAFLLGWPVALLLLDLFVYLLAKWEHD